MNRRVVSILAFPSMLAVAGLIAFAVTDAWESRRAIGDDLAWLSDDLGLRGETLDQARALHRGHREATRRLVSEIRAAEAEVHALAQPAAGGSDRALGDAIRRLDGLRAEMQVAVLSHAREIQRLLEPAEQERFLREMERHVLGVAVHPGATNSPSPHAHAGIP